MSRVFLCAARHTPSLLGMPTQHHRQWQPSVTPLWKEGRRRCSVPIGPTVETEQPQN